MAGRAKSNSYFNPERLNVKFFLVRSLTVSKKRKGEVPFNTGIPTNIFQNYLHKNNLTMYYIFSSINY